ncbi:Uncharacterised protein [uncultured archaeon]|nr:Uncharacterised protein [uncultured archaeon]
MIKVKNFGKFMRASFVLLPFIFFAFIPVVSASITKTSVEDLTGEADVIVIGDVKEVASRWNLWRTMIYTYSTLSVEKYIKGAGPETLTMITEGGTVGDSGIWVEDVPVFAKNETVLVFLKHAGSEFSVAGWVQGKYIVENENVRDLSGEKTSLKEFLRRIEDAIPEDAVTPVRTPAAQVSPEAPGFEIVLGIIGVLAVWRGLKK